MEAVKEAISKHGNTWNLKVLHEMVDMYENLHALSADHKPPVQVEKAIKYGENDRNRIDVYYPKDKSKLLLPVVVFFHGGAFTSGDNDATRHIHSNIGKYFASHNCVACLGTYRLVPGARFPDGPDDIAAALQWVETNIESYGGDPTRVTAIGHSSGGAHLANAVFMRRVKSLLKRAVLLSTPMSFDLTQKRRRDTMTEYFNTEDQGTILSKYTSLAIFQEMEEEPQCNILVIVAGLDSEEHAGGNLAFVEEYRKRYYKAPAFEIMENQNHVSHVFGIGLDGDKLGPRLLRLL